MRQTHIYSGLLIAIISLIFLFYIIPNHTAPAQSELDLAPSLVPSIAVGICLFMAAIMVFSALTASESEAEELDDEFGAEATGADLDVMLNTLSWTIASIVAWLIMDYVGFEAAMALFMCVTMVFVGVRNKLTIALTSILTPVLMSLAVFNLFDTELPIGRFEDFWFALRTLGM